MFNCLDLSSGPLSSSDEEQLPSLDYSTWMKQATHLFKRKRSDWLKAPSAISILTYNFQTLFRLPRILQVSSQPTQVSLSVLSTASSRKFAMNRFNRQVFQAIPRRASFVQQRSIHVSSLSPSELVNESPSALPTIAPKPTNDSAMCVPKVFPGQAVVWLVKTPWNVSNITKKVDEVNEDCSTQSPAQKNSTRGTEQSGNRPVEIVTIWPHLW